MCELTIGLCEEQKRVLHIQSELEANNLLKALYKASDQSKQFEDQYQIIEGEAGRLGQGSFGEVFRALDKSSLLMVAVK